MYRSLCLAGLVGGAAYAKGRGEKTVAEFAAGGLIFKDTVEIIAFPDPKVDITVCRCDHGACNMFGR
jgi:hypothetical protein